MVYFRIGLQLLVLLCVSCTSSSNGGDGSDEYTQNAILQELYITPQTDTQCESVYSDSFDSGSMVCAGDSEVGVCSGDSGGPLFYDDGTDNILLGVTSWTINNCEYTYYKYGGFADVYEFVGWIEATTNYDITATSMEHSDSIVQPTIIGGIDAETDNHEYFVTLMTKYPDYTGYYYPFCGGSYLGDGWVLTAAHCVDDLSSEEQIYLLVGNYSDEMAYEVCTYDEFGVDCTWSADSESEDATGFVLYIGSYLEIHTVTGSDITVHDDWRGDVDDLENDIALIQLGPSPWPSNESLSLPSTDLFAELAEDAEQNPGSDISVMVIGHGLSD
ncbi:trypsin-like serine protease [Reinekea thalattae]|uniref:Trypsin-like serine protease n=1 Tax=Reinekea thalattae TaxID=2593301 RepID=A0A5C8Z958_9GAMM|nr:trypsin-like serine protease [Reinekea thalattae]TXR54237.1 trypsin-like serine protease [Reinekea thalattae]